MGQLLTVDLVEDYSHLLDHIRQAEERLQIEGLLHATEIARAGYIHICVCKLCHKNRLKDTRAVCK